MVVLAVTLVQPQIVILAVIAVTAAIIAAIIVAVKNAAGGSSGKIKIAATEMIAVADVTVVVAAVAVIS